MLAETPGTSVVTAWLKSKNKPHERRGQSYARDLSAVSDVRESERMASRWRVSHALMTHVWGLGGVVRRSSEVERVKSNEKW